MAEEDILFGKNMHLFGGIEPNNMLEFKSAYRNGVVELTAHLPKDTVVDGQTLCTVAGAVIRRKSDGYPVNEFDGVLVDDITSSRTMIDRISNPNTGYYYAAFPYTTQGVYNRNPINRTKINIPDPVISFSAKSSYDYTTEIASIELVVNMSEGISAVIRRSQTAYPISETDGDECMSITSSGTYTDNNVTLGETYYYSIFTCNDLGVYNRDISKSVVITCNKYNYIFGYDLDLEDENPRTRVTYPNDTDNANFKAAFMNYGAGEFDYGDWPSSPGTYFMPRPCMLTYDGVVEHYLDPNDYSKQENGVYSSYVSDSTRNCNAMMEWPKIYTHREYDSDSNTYKFRCSDVKQGDDWDCWCNYDVNNNVIDKFYTSIYISTYVDTSYGTKLRSLSDNTVLSGEQQSTFRTRSQYYGSGDNFKRYATWDIGLLSDYLLIRDLLVMMGKSTDCQTVYGNGRCKPTKINSTTGELNDKGLFWGSDSVAEGVKVFGMENWWGNHAQFLAGWFCYQSTDYLKITKGNKDTTSPSTPCNDAYKAWQKFSSETSGDGTMYYGTKHYIRINQRYDDVGTMFTGSGGYIKELTVKDFGVIPYLTGGSATTYECDTLIWAGSTSSSTKYDYSVGGNVSHLFENGPFWARVVPNIESPSYTGAFLSYKTILE